MYEIGQKVTVRVPDKHMHYYEKHRATIKEFDGTTWKQNEDWYTVTLDSGEITRVRDVNIQGE